MNGFIDIHGHCVQEHFVPYLSGAGKGRHQISDPSEMLEFYAFHGVERGVLLPLCNAENAMQSQSNEEVLNIVRLHPGKFVPFCNVDPRNIWNDSRSPYADVLKWYRDRGCRGLGELCCNLHFLDPRVQSLFKAAEEVGFPVTFHVAPYADNNYGLIDGNGLPELEESLRRFPNLRFFGHSQAFWAEIGILRGQDARFGFPQGKIEREGRVVELMRKYPNLYGDLSARSGLNALARDRSYAARFLTEFQDRLMFGMDICSPEAERQSPISLDRLLLDMVANGEITQTVFDRITRENAARLLGL